MKTEFQLTDQHLFEQAEASLATALRHLDEASLAMLALSLTQSEERLGSLASFAVYYELHRRAQNQ